MSAVFLKEMSMRVALWLLVSMLLVGCAEEAAQERPAAVAPQTATHTLATPSVAATPAPSGPLVAISASQPSELLSFSFLDELRGWAIDVSGELYTTEDGGQTWDTLFQFALNDWGPLRGVDFVSPEVGWALSNQHVYKTVDRGTSWTPLVLPPADRVKAIDFVDEHSGWMIIDAGQQWSSQLFVTSDGGLTWVEPRWAVPCTGWFGRLTSTEAWMLCADGRESGDQTYKELYWTLDGGQTWNLTAWSDAPGLAPGGVLPRSPVVRSVFFLNRERGWISLSQDHEAGLIVTDDGGRTWRKLEPNAKGLLSCMQFMTSEHGYAFTSWYRSPAYVLEIVETFDGGATWEPSGLPSMVRPHFRLPSCTGW